ncbi:MAG: DUF2264 domain-containing protein [Chthoniobacteraceae bacterium]|nr:DUF2264 domain-containing protein [Chthoniobacteraceae bacterium]
MNASLPLPGGSSQRADWIGLLTRIARPPLEAAASGSLLRRMPGRWNPDVTSHPRSTFAALEIVARTLLGIAPWLEARDADPAEEPLRETFASLARAALAAVLAPDSPDRLNFTVGEQPLVDAAFLCQALLRAPGALWEPLDDATKRRLIEGVRATRLIKPGISNWLCFSGVIEAFLARFDAAGDWDAMRIDYVLRQHEDWYKGGGVYGDGPRFAWDYYNSYVIHPALLEITDCLSGVCCDWDAWIPVLRGRAREYAVTLEQLVAPDGTFPAIGRSITYRMGAFHLLAYAAWKGFLPTGGAGEEEANRPAWLHPAEPLPPSQVRCALTAVMRRMMDAPGTFDENGWLAIGVCGRQPALGDVYISTASLYLCTAIFLPLGLPPGDPFWSGPAMPWTSARLWSGEDLARPAAPWRDDRRVMDLPFQGSPGRPAVNAIRDGNRRGQA